VDRISVGLTLEGEEGEEDTQQQQALLLTQLPICQHLRSLTNNSNTEDSIMHHHIATIQLWDLRHLTTQEVRAPIPATGIIREDKECRNDAVIWMDTGLVILVILLFVGCTQ
jgi:hypothetical protein